MIEIRLWKWEYTDASGRRQVSRWRMTEHEAVRYKDPVRLQHTLLVRYERDRPAVSGLKRGPTCGPTWPSSQRSSG